MDLLEVLVDALLGVLRSARRHADSVMGLREVKGRAGETSANTRRLIPPIVHNREGDHGRERSESQSSFKMPTTTVTFDAM